MYLPKPEVLYILNSSTHDFVAVAAAEEMEKLLAPEKGAWKRLIAIVYNGRMLDCVRTCAYFCLLNSNIYGGFLC